MREIDNPDVTGRRDSAFVNVRATPLEWLASRGKIDAVEKAAGEQFARLHHQAQLGGAKAIAYRERVQSGGKADPLTDKMMEASRELQRATREIGEVASRVLELVVVREMGIVETAKLWARTSGIVTGERAEGFITGTLVEALRRLAKFWRMIATGPPIFLEQPEAGILASGVVAGAKIECRVSAASSGMLGSGPVSITGPGGEFVLSGGDLVKTAKRPSAAVPLDRAAMTTHAQATRKRSARRRQR